jgi:Amt family ammonium transporter
VNSAGANGLFYGNPRQLLVQFIAVIVSVGFSFFGSAILLRVTDALIGLRVDDEDEVMGLDLSQHDENAYALEA